ncbi:acyltransferase family protein [Actinophytocola sediminis]
MGPEIVPDKTRTSFLDIARALAAILVVYTHIYDVFIREHKGVTTPPTDAVDNALVVPLKLDDQGIGAISVPLFFIISGFVVTPIALRMGPGRFGINRAFRIFPLLVFVVAVAAVLIALGNGLLSTNPQEVTFWSFLSNVSLWNFIDRPFGSWVAVAWTLAVEVLFYAMLIAVLPLLRKRAWLAIAVQLEVVLILLITHSAFGDEYRALVINMVYTLIPLMGQAIWAAWAGKIPAWLAGVYVLVAWLMFVWSGHLSVDPNYIPRAFPIALALLVFLIGLFAEPYLRQRRFWTELSERTYSIYLLHGVVAFPLMHWLFNRLPLWLTVLVAVVGTALAAELSYRFVEGPSHNLARRLSKRQQPPPPPPEDVEDEFDEDEDEDLDAIQDDDAEFDDDPTEKTPPVPPPPQRRRPAPWSRPPTPVELKTEKIEPVARPNREAGPGQASMPRGGGLDRTPKPSHNGSAPSRNGTPRRDAAPGRNGTPNLDPAPGRNGMPHRNGTPRDVDHDAGPSRSAIARRGEPGDHHTPASRDPRDTGSQPHPAPPIRPTPPGRRRAEEAARNGTPSNGTPGNGTPGNGTPHNGTPRNGTPANAPRWPESDSAPGGRRRAEDRDDHPPATNGRRHLENGNGRRRRAEDILNGSRRAEPTPTPSSVTWPDEHADPDGGQPPRGRHRSD